jgi:hypothetical protein
MTARQWRVAHESGRLEELRPTVLTLVAQIEVRVLRRAVRHGDAQPELTCPRRVRHHDERSDPEAVAHRTSDAQCAAGCP